MEKRFSYKRSAIFLVILGFFAYLLKLSLNIFLARHLPKALYGDFMLALQTLSIASALLLLGTGTAAQRFLSYYLRSHQQENVQSYVSWNTKLLIRSCIIFLATLSIFLLLLIVFHLYGLKSLSTYHLAMYTLFISPLGAVSILLANYLKCNNNIYIASFFIQSGKYICSFLVLVAGVYVFDVSLTVPMLWAGVFGAILMLAIIELFCTWLAAPNIINSMLSQNTANKSTEYKTWYETSMRLITNQVIFLVLSALDLYLVEIITRSEEEVGHYAAILAIAGILYLVSSSVYQFITPKVSTYLKEGKLAKLQSALNSGLMISTTILIALVILMVFWGRELLAHFGVSYNTEANYHALIILLLAYLIRSYSRPSILLLVNSGNERILIIASVIELAALLIVGSILVYTMGLVGLAIANVISISIKTVIFIWVAKTRTRCRPLGLL